MGKIATTIEWQKAKLQERGMELDCPDEKLREHLLDIGYYRLGFYWNPFEIDNKHNFNKGTKFSDALKLYYLDVDLRHLLIKYINRIEINFRTKVVYYVSNRHPDSPTWFVDSKVVNRWYIDDFPKYYEQNIKLNYKPIKDHHAKHINDRYAPAWKTIEFMSFGAVQKLFKNLKDKDVQNTISREFEIKKTDKFINLIQTVVHLRNICAHGAVLFDLQVPRGVKKLPGLNLQNDRHSLNAAIKVVLFLLGKVSENRKVEMEEAVHELLDKHKKNEVLKTILEEKMMYAFPE